MTSNAMQKTFARDERGATILEFLIYLTIVGLVLSVAVLFAADFVATQVKSSATIETSRNARFAVDRIAAEVRQATGITAGSSVFDTHPGTLTLPMAAAGDNPTVFTVTDGVLTVQQGAGAAIPLTSSQVDVTSFIVENLSVGNKTRAVRITVTASYKNVGGLVQFAATETIQTTAKVQKDDGFAP